MNTVFRATQNRIIFQFVDETTNSNFKNKTNWGFEFTQHAEELKSPRWGVITHIGSKIKEVEVGQYILIEPLMWTLGMTMPDGTYWTTAIDKVMAVSDEHPHS